MKRLIILLPIILIFFVTSCAIPSGQTGDHKQSSKGLKSFENEDFSFEYPSNWTLATHGGSIGGLTAIEKGVISLNNFGKKEFWVKPITGIGGRLADGGLITADLPNNATYIFIATAGLNDVNSIDGLDNSAIEMDSSARFIKQAKKELEQIDKIPENYGNQMKKIWSNNRSWVNYRLKFRSHGNSYALYAYLCDDAIKTDKSKLDQMMKSLKIVSVAKDR